jgi:glycosyltransferase involved in cell wall biosynthesis
VIEPIIKANSSVEFIGEIGEHQKAEFLGNARALLFPIDWPEPFGLVMIEAMACGTPVVAFKAGSVPEIIDNGVNGVVVETIDQAVEAVLRLESLDRAKVRAAFEKRFTVERMALGYLDIYRSLPGVRGGLARNRWVNGSVSHPRAIAQGERSSTIDLLPRNSAKRRPCV